MSERDPSPRPEDAPRPSGPPAPDDVVQALADFMDDLVEDPTEDVKDAEAEEPR